MTPAPPNSNQATTTANRPLPKYYNALTILGVPFGIVLLFGMAIESFIALIVILVAVLGSLFLRTSDRDIWDSMTRFKFLLSSYKTLLVVPFFVLLLIASNYHPVLTALFGGVLAVWITSGIYLLLMLRYRRTGDPKLLWALVPAAIALQASYCLLFGYFYVVAFLAQWTPR